MKKILGALALAATSVLALVSCNKDVSNSNKTNEEVPLIFSTQEVDKVFNPFYSTTGPDSNVVAMTQISMIGNDKNGKPTCGEDEPVVVLDYDITTTGTGNEQRTLYSFVLKNNVKFSNGSPLTMKDVLFNLYVYLDPAYTGSSTIYSTDIVGLQEYRTQSSDENEQDSFMDRFRLVAKTRVDNLLLAWDEIYGNSILDLTPDQFKEALTTTTVSSAEYGDKLVEDFEKTMSLFKEELESDYSLAVDTYQDIVFTSEDGTLIKNKFTTDVEAFLYNEGYITFDKKDNDGKGSFSCAFGSLDDVKTWTKEQAINMIYEEKIPGSLDEILNYWATATNLSEYLTNIAMQEYFEENTDRLYKNISGIKFANRTESVTVKGKEYQKVEYNEDGSPKEGYNEVLTIEINGVDPKAIWNFAFAVAPLYYYSGTFNDKDYIATFDYESNFGVEYGSTDFQEEVIKNPDKIGVPVGAGAYKASKNSGGSDNITAGDFYDKGVIYFERNEYFLMGAPIIKKVRYQVVSQNSMINSLYSGDIDFVEPNAKPETIDELNDKKGEGIGNQSVQTSGYGYIGINASKVPTLEVRQAIMHAINTLECVNYYKNTAKAIYRPMSLSSWAYPEGATAYYPYIGGTIPTNLDVVNPYYKDFVEAKNKKPGEVFTADEQKEFITQLVEGAGYSLGGDGVYVDSNGNRLEYTFTIAGQETDHPAWQALFLAGTFLNKCGFKITTTTDAQALKKLASGSLTVWAAAWSSTIDPDMYQVYHKDSKASSTNNWGYKQILQNIGNKYNRELAIVNDLSDLIDQAREITDENKRAAIYKDALDEVMKLAVELPTYQRDDLFAYNTNKLDESSLTPSSELSPYNGLTSKNWLLRLNEIQ